MKSVEEILKKHAEWGAIATIFHTLEQKGHLAYLAGGCVRDALLGVTAHDLDIATDATPEQIESYFDKVVSVGKSFGVMRVLVDGQDIEVATFRTDGQYKDGRRPDAIHFSSPEKDAQRRDFTVNALFYDLKSQHILDFVGGIPDLQNRILKTVGQAERRFAEDHLRLLRGARFVGQLGFKLDPETFAAIKKESKLIRSVSGERVRDEMGKLLRSTEVNDGLEVMWQSGLMAELFPAQKKSVFPGGRTQELWQNLALLFRDLGKEDLLRNMMFLRLSVKEQKNIEEFWKVWQAPTTFLDKRKGERLQLFQHEGVRWALRMIVLDQAPFAVKAQTAIDEAYQQGVLPEPLLKGNDLKGKLSGPDMGKCLSEAYIQQLEKSWTSHAEALLWLQEYLQKGSS